MPAEKPKYIVVDQNFHARIGEGEIVVPLAFKAGLYRKVVAAGDGVIQFATVLDGLELNQQLDTFDDLGLKEASELSDEYFTALAGFLGAELGK